MIKVFNLPDCKDSSVKVVFLEVAISMAFKTLLLAFGSFLGNFLPLSFVFILHRIRVRPERVESSDWSSLFERGKRVNLPELKLFLNLNS